ncbi:hypothetical protein PC116_g13108 [Phytophthora cactorum]|uniref:Uncharacterized protein n=1 Tax=Phytophthora cactorum TaxID=29920 RepID=A0A8T0Z8W5_9STRA|nr:hypothetical protein PC112_g14428 [Phytophthora cactorum]KAG2827843.1 hypothetical protein PC111_g8410 [Phytophthora cactorum]KAG2858424.1 hypothetical protein PC113_g9821 [Phytophthora cactorum]KAG2908294.1 hypothetical protein PC114_g10508 [Phytophthora cactorum]KAG2923737.1 hypothetical protein PC115_g8843 [Phytophthora cactorum]
MSSHRDRIVDSKLQSTIMIMITVAIDDKVCMHMAK